MGWSEGGGVTIKESGLSIGSRRTLNLIEGANITITPVDDPTNQEVDVTIAATVAAGGNPQTEVGGRLTLTSGTAVTTADVTGATTIYYTPYIHDRIGLYDGSEWDSLAFTETSLALGTLDSGKPYDVFAYNNSGTLALEALAWTNDSTRATALTRQNGVLSKTGALTRRYLGTFYTTSTTATEDSKANRYLVNYYNRVDRDLLATPAYVDNNAAATFTLTANVFEAVNGGTGATVSYLSLGEDVISVKYTANVGMDVDQRNFYIGLGDNSATSARVAARQFSESTNDNWEQVTLTYDFIPAVGRRTLSMLGVVLTAGTTATFLVDTGRLGSSADPYATFLAATIRG